MHRGVRSSGPSLTSGQSGLCSSSLIPFSVPSPIPEEIRGDFSKEVEPETLWSQVPRYGRRWVYLRAENWAGNREEAGSLPSHRTDVTRHIPLALLSPLHQHQTRKHGKLFSGDTEWSQKTEPRYWHGSSIEKLAYCPCKKALWRKWGNLRLRNNTLVVIGRENWENEKVEFIKEIM